MSKKQYDDDDGRVIAKMNVEGMPDYRPGPSLPQSESNDASNPPPTKKEIRALMLNAVAAALAIAAVFAVAAALFILFCTNCWLRG